MDIPPEILYAFIKFSEDDPKTLLNLCLVSRSCAGEAQKVLYRSIRISGSSSARRSFSPNAVLVLLKLFQTFTQHNPLLAKYVQTLSYHPNFPFHDRQYRELINKSFQLMTNLESLTIPVKLPPDLFEGCTFQLKKLFFPAPSLRDAYGQDMFQFLSSQSRLKALYINMDDSHPPVDCCDSLETLCGNQYTIESILPGRPTITRLVWVTSWTDYLGSPPSRILDEFSNIHILSLGSSLSHPSLKLLAPRSRSLRVLRLVGESAASARHSVDDELEHLPELVNLRIFVWSAQSIGRFDHEYADSMVDQERQRGLVTKWFKDMQVLEVAYFQVAETSHPKHYLRWRRNEIDPSPVDIHEAVIQHGLMPWLEDEANT